MRKTTRFGIAGFLCLFSATITVAAALPHPTQAQKFPQSSAQQQLIRSQTKNETAQAEYYREKTEDIQAARRPKSFWQKLTDNPLAIGAFVTAFVALFSFILNGLNYRATLRSQRDTQFYEALKRFGDESQMIRCSAAALLAELGEKVRRYRRPALDQLAEAIRLEDRAAVLSSIQSAIRELAPGDPRWAFRRLQEANRRLQKAMGYGLADYFAAMGAKPGKKIDRDRWKEAAGATRYREDVLRRFADSRARTFESVLRASPHAESRTPLQGQLERQAERLGALWAEANRLRASVHLLAYTLAHCRKSLPEQELGGIFLLGWWEADFLKRGSDGLDRGLLDRLWRAAGSTLPEPDPNDECHPSVREFIQKKRQEEQGKDEARLRL